MVIEQLRHCLEMGAWDDLAQVYAVDALLDANVPLWRFQRKGLEEITAQYRDWYPHPLRILDWTVTPTRFGAVLEQADQAGEGDEQTYSRSLHLLHVEGDRIVRHVLYCTGQWDRPTVERQALEAPVHET